MFVRVPKETDLIRLPSHFARLVNVLESGDLVFEVRHQVRQSDIVKRGAQIVKVSVVTKIAPRIDVLHSPGQVGISGRLAVKNLLSFIPNVRNAIRNNDTFLVAWKNVDNSAGLDTQLIADIKRIENPRNVAGLYKPKLVLKSVRELNAQNDVKPFLQVNRAEVEAENTSYRNLIQQGILRHGFDPSHVAKVVDSSVLTARESLSGVFLKSTITNPCESKSKYFDKITRSPKALPSHTGDVSDEMNVLVVETMFADDVEIVSQITLPIDRLTDASKNFKPAFFKFELLNSHGIVIQTIQESVDILQHIETFYAPRVAPIVEFARFETTGKVNIQVKQMDPRAVGVRIYKKDFSYVSNVANNYQLVTKHDVEYGSGFETISVDASTAFSTIYRVIPVGKNNAMGSEFTNIVINPTKVHRRRTYVSLTTRVVSNGVSIDITDIPLDVVSFVIMRRDTTIRSSFEIIGDDVLQVDPNNASQTYSIIDTNVKQHHVYEYFCRLIYRSGSTFDAGRAFIEYERLVENLVDTRIENVTTELGIDNLNVRFKIKTIINESNTDSIKKLLERQGLASLFSDDLFREREKLQKLIAHQVYRVNITEGIKENFGIITDEDFSDSHLRLINSIQPLKAGNTYRYEVIALLRSPETMFDEYVKTSIDVTTKKRYSFKPSKFLHPITLRRGNITTPQTLTEKYPQSQFSFGSVGNICSAEVSFSNDLVFVVNANAEAFDSKTMVIRWGITGKSDQIDHFIIMKESMGQRHIVGKSHAVNDTSTFRFLHELTTSDLGELVYIIIPVFDTYDVGTEVKTNKVVIE